MGDERKTTRRGGVSKRAMKPIEVRNRDIPLLRNVLYTMQLVGRTEQNLDWQHDRMMRITQHVTGMPGGGALPKGLDSAFAELEEVGEAYEEQLREYIRELREAERILNGIESRVIQTFVVMKYIMDEPDAAIRRELNMTEWRFNKMRKAIEGAEDMASVAWKE